MSRGLSAAAKAELYAANCSGVWLTLLTIEHEDLAAPLRFVGDRQDLTSRGDDFTALAFTARLPADRDGPVAAEIVLDNVERVAVVALRSITSPATVTIEIVRRSDPDTVLVSYPELQLVGARISAAQAVLELSADPVLDESFPGTDFTPLLFPAGFDR